jgi:hypothetical protein
MCGCAASISLILSSAFNYFAKLSVAHPVIDRSTLLQRTGNQDGGETLAWGTNGNWPFGWHRFEQCVQNIKLWRYGMSRGSSTTS